jgi:predicted transcriptional regulator
MLEQTDQFDGENNDATTAEEGYEEWVRSEIEAGLADADAGRTVSGEKVAEWLRSWGTDHELSPPECD